ncbi:hypothetical protein FRC11_012097, partial [Ceratobasidium sp. 423]
MKRWEDARDSLAHALTSYLASCTSLEATLYPGPGRTNAMYITSRIDSTLDSLQYDMTQHLVQSTSTLARTRNRLVSPIWRLPEDVLFDIFLYVVYAPEIKKLSTKDCLQAMYSNLHNLVAVCSVWRNLAMSQGVLWETIPACDQNIKYRAIDLSIQRAGNRGLRLATILPIIHGQRGAPSHLVEIVKKHASRFRALNLEGEYLSTINNLVSEMLLDGIPSQLSELCIDVAPPVQALSIERSFRVLRGESPDQATFTRLTESLSILRLRKADIEWENTAFSDRLVELFIHGVRLGHSESSLNTFLSAISSATELRDLRIISVWVIRNPMGAIHPTKHPNVTLPKLQSLLLYDLPFHILESFIPAIAPGSYHYTLGLTRKALHNDYLTDTYDVDRLDALAALLKLVKIGKLVLTGAPRLSWLDELGVHRVLASMPSLKELYMVYWTFLPPPGAGLLPSAIAATGRGEFVLPVLESLELIRTEIVDEGQFKNLLANISTRKMVLGGYTVEGENRTELKGDEDIVDWLKGSVPDFRLASSRYFPDEAEVPEWTL